MIYACVVALTLWLADWWHVRRYYGPMLEWAVIMLIDVSTLFRGVELSAMERGDCSRPD